MSHPARRLLQATYSPSAAKETEGRPARALEKFALVRRVNLLSFPPSAVAKALSVLDTFDVDALTDLEKVLGAAAASPIADSATVAAFGRLSDEIVVAACRWAVEQYAARSTGLVATERGTYKVDPSKAVDPVVVDAMRTAIQMFEAPAPVPVGYLSLERLDFVDDGLELGELVYSVALAPGEIVHLSHRTWSNTQREFAEIISSATETDDDQEIAEKAELAQSTTSQQQHTLGLNTSVSASGSYGSVSLSAQASLSLQHATTVTDAHSRNQTLATTRKASSRSRQEHKVSFKVASASGTEDQEVKRIANPYPDRPIRYDYRQVNRRWRVDLRRYGARLTYDLTIPEPGLAMLARLQQISVLQARLDAPFDSTVFPLRPTDLAPETLDRYAADYGAAVDACPPVELTMSASDTQSWPNRDASNTVEFHTIGIEIDHDYVVETADLRTAVSPWNTDPADHTFYVYDPFDARNEVNVAGATGWAGRTGHLNLGYRTWKLNSCLVEVTLHLKLRDEVYRAWQLKAWTQFRDAALARYYANQQALRDRIDRLRAEAGPQDPLSLRKNEREEVMKGVLQWLLGPDFRFVPTDEPDNLYGSGGGVVSDYAYAEVRAHGQMIQFLHHALEWEGMTYFLYPYFWSNLGRWDIKLWLDHSDFLHRVFLRSGAARVVVPIRRGFEEAFVRFVDSGTIDGDSPYITIAQEFEEFANTSYPDIPRSTDPAVTDQAELGVLVGSWHEYTPTEALDISIGSSLSATPPPPTGP